jgi:glycosyltransferase involved in cell wall biosynthesis
MKRVLMVSEKFPPFNVSGSARPFYFAKYLPEHGYLPTVIGERVPKDAERDETLLGQLPTDVQIFRSPRIVTPTFAALSELVGAHFLRRARARRARSAGPAVTEATPASGGAGARAGGSARTRRFDESTWVRLGPNAMLFRWWLNWEIDWGVTATLASALGVARAKPDLVWVSGPHFRSYEVGRRLSTWLGVPLVIDMRDPWTYGSLWRPKTPQIAAAERKRAVRALSAAARVVFTSPLTQQTMAERFPEVDSSRWSTITNGYDDVQVEPLRDERDDVCVFRYIGTLNRRRTPDVLIQALAKAAQDPELRASAALELIGNAGGHEPKVALAPGCAVRFRGQVSRSDSLRYAFGGDVLILLQTIGDGQDVVSGKAFEYLHAGKPILAVVDPGGGDAWLMRETGAGEIAPWTDVDAVAAAMRRAWQAWRERRQNGYRAAPRSANAAYSRRALTGQLARLFDEVIAERRR